MPEFVFCAACQRRNLANAINCVHCGALLSRDRTGPKTTEKISESYPSPDEIALFCQNYLPYLPSGALALFVMNYDTPILVQDSSYVQFGRMIERNDASHVDLSDFGAFESGVSRLHARITNDNGIYKIEDLGSKNGTYVNQYRLVSGKIYELHNGDLIRLGHLLMVACCHEAERIETISFDLEFMRKSDTAPLQLLTPGFLITQVGEYLQAIRNLEEIYYACNNKPFKDVYILSINSVDKDSIVHVELNGGTQAVNLMREWNQLIKKTKVNKFFSNDYSANSNLQAELKQVCVQMLLSISPELDGEEIFNFVQQLYPILCVLSNSDLDIKTTV